MSVDQYSREIQEVTDSLGELCRPYGVVPEVLPTVRAKRNPTTEEWQQGADFVIDPAKFDSRELGYVVILRRTKEVDWRDIELDELRDKIFGGGLNVADLSIEIGCRG
jgi:hypothetical protein